MYRTINSGGRRFNLNKWSLLRYNAVFKNNNAQQSYRYLMMVHHWFIDFVHHLVFQKQQIQNWNCFHPHTKGLSGIYSDGSDSDYQSLANLHLLHYLHIYSHIILIHTGFCGFVSQFYLHSTSFLVFPYASIVYFLLLPTHTEELSERVQRLNTAHQGRKQIKFPLSFAEY
jgi:hypothetical protein